MTKQKTKQPKAYERITEHPQVYRQQYRLMLQLIKLQRTRFVRAEQAGITGLALKALSDNVKATQSEIDRLLLILGRLKEVRTAESDGYRLNTLRVRQ